MKFFEKILNIKILLLKDIHIIIKSLFNAILLSSIIGVGSYLQIAIISLLDDKEFSVHREHQTVFPSLSDFFESSYLPENIIFSFFIFILFFKIKNTTTKLIFLYFSVVLFVTALDIIYQIKIFKLFNKEIFLEHLICNFIGFFLACCIVILLNSFLSHISQTLTHKKKLIP